MKTAPIILFVYNRPLHTQQTINALLKNTLSAESTLIVYSDGPKLHANDDVKKVRDYLKSIKGFKETKIIERSENWGLAKNIIEGVTETLQEYDRTIVLEDDLVTSPYFLTYMNQALELYQDESKVASIHGYIYPTTEHLSDTFFLLGADCSGWGTWRRAWNFFEPDGKKLLKKLRDQNLCHKFDYNGSYPFTKMLKDFTNGRNNSWAVRWYASAFLENMLTLYPGKSLIQNIGMDGSGTHCGETDILDTEISTNPVLMEKLDIKENPRERVIIATALKSTNIRLSKMVAKKLLFIAKNLAKKFTFSRDL